MEKMAPLQSQVIQDVEMEDAPEVAKVTYLLEPEDQSVTSSSEKDPSSNSFSSFGKSSSVDESEWSLHDDGSNILSLERQKKHPEIQTGSESSSL